MKGILREQKHIGETYGAAASVDSTDSATAATASSNVGCNVKKWSGLHIFHFERIRSEGVKISKESWRESKLHFARLSHEASSAYNMMALLKAAGAESSDSEGDADHEDDEGDAANLDDVLSLPWKQTCRTMSVPVVEENPADSNIQLDRAYPISPSLVECAHGKHMALQAQTGSLLHVHPHPISISHLS